MGSRVEKLLNCGAKHKFNFCEPSERSVCEFILSNYIQKLYNKMTFWADNIKFIKDVLDSKYKKIEDALADLQEHTDGLDKEGDNKKLKDLFVEAMRSVELINMDELNTLAETMFADMPESEKGKEQDRLKEITGKRTQAMTLIADGKKKWKISAF